MRTLFTSLLALVLLSQVNAQTNTFDTAVELRNLLKSKSDYERYLTLRNKPAEANKIKYEQAYEEIKSQREQVLSYIQQTLTTNDAALNKYRINYEYVSPASSFHDDNNFISLLKFYQIVKYSLENNRKMLPKLYTNTPYSIARTFNPDHELRNLLEENRLMNSVLHWMISHYQKIQKKL
jgi:hypothetical protein